MTKRTDLHDVLDGLLIPGEEKVAGPDLSGLSLFELGALMGIKTASPELDKQAYGICGPYDGERWLEQFSGSPLYEKAIALAERELAVEQKAVAAREKRKQEFRIDDSTWREHDKLRLDKDKLILELHKYRAKEQARNMKVAEDVEYTGQVNNGIASNPGWPRAALGVDAAGRRATPEEKREQEKSVTPDVQHVQPQSDGGSFVTKGAHDEKLLGLFEKEAQEDKTRKFGIKGRYFGRMSEEQAKEILERRDKGTPFQRISLLRMLAVHRANKVLEDTKDKKSSLAAVGAALGRPF